MAPSGKNAAAATDRRKSAATSFPRPSNGTTVIRANGQVRVNFKLAPDRLRAILDPTAVKKEDSPSTSSKTSAQDSPAVAALATANPDTASAPADSNANTPATGTPVPPASVMGPPTEGPKKKGTKRGAAALNGEPKVRGKPGPKKKQRLDDGTIEGGTGRANGLGSHKLGPKANQGAINAGLRALDRTGKPCRKWQKGGFTLKSFTGVVWEIPRWTAPPKPKPAAPTSSATTVENSAAASAEGSSKENMDKENSSPQELGGPAVKSENNSNPGGVNGDVNGDVQPSSGPASVLNGASPTPMAIAAA